MAIHEGTYAQKQLCCSNQLIAWSHQGRFQTACKLLQQHASTASTLLDYGCGDGTFLALITDLIPNAVGVDISQQHLDDCQQRLLPLLPTLRFQHINTLSAEYNQRYDAIVCMEVLEHCLETAQENALKDLQRLARPQACVLISVPVEIGCSLLAKQSLRTIAGWLKQGDYGHSVERYTPAEFFKMLWANRHTQMDRAVYYVGTPHASYGHQGFNWQVLEQRLQQYFTIESVVFSPLPWLGKWLNSQVFFICRPHSSRSS